MPRKPASDRYDLVVGLEPAPAGEIPRFAYALAKLTYAIEGSRAVLAEPEPLAFDLYGDEPLDPRFPPGTDYWLDKTSTDVVLLGSAHSPGGRPALSMSVRVDVGKRTKRIAVFGRREIVRAQDGHPSIREPEPFLEMPLGYENAYGGMDPRVPLAEGDREAFVRLASAGLATDHPGLYPRNAIGKGYLVYPEPLEGLEMPNLEDPDDLLTAERLVVGAPELWYRQPLPWSFGWTNGLMYPRELFAGFDAWFPCPDERELPEVKRGLLRPGIAGAARTQRTQGQVTAEYYQEASLGLVAAEALAGHPVRVVGMHPAQPSVDFSIPEAPAMEVVIDGERHRPKAMLTSLVIRPAEKTFYAVYCARTASLPRDFIPGIHKNIPLSASVHGEAPISYVSPPTIRDRLAAANGP
jgi:Uncharacterized protein conserved in bacteria (DUF2169)